MRLMLAALALAGAPAFAQQLVVSAAPSTVAVTAYRNPARHDAIEPDSLQGFALVTETRDIDLPAGPAIIRFEGVAGNILPESAVVGGVPAGVREKNLDADLLSPRTLYDRLLGRRVLVRRTDTATGRVTTEQAVIRSSAAGAAVLQFPGRFEALGCAGLPEQIVYPAVPAGLSAKPTLSIRTQSTRATRARLTLSYLAGGFDWQADYTVTLQHGQATADLFAFVTIASNDITSFPDAATAAVAGKTNRVDAPEDAGERWASNDGLALRCWPTRPNYARDLPTPPPLPAPPPSMMMASVQAMDIVVTASRIAVQEELGDLKLYRFPERVTVASQAQKQIMLLHRPAAAVQLVYRQEVSGDSADTPQLIVRMRNRAADGLGLPLPAGPVSVFEQAGERRVLLDTVPLTDKAVGERVELKLPAGPGVHGVVEVRDEPARRYRLVVTNANPWPVAYEARVSIDDDQRLAIETGRVIKEDGASIWAVTIPANGTAHLDYHVIDTG